jgi:hypothetical protein
VSLPSPGAADSFRRRPLSEFLEAEGDFKQFIVDKAVLEKNTRWARATINKRSCIVDT